MEETIEGVDRQQDQAKRARTSALPEVDSPVAFAVTPPAHASRPTGARRSTASAAAAGAYDDDEDDDDDDEEEEEEEVHGPCRALRAAAPSPAACTRWEDGEEEEEVEEYV